jgi:hypothetical protein
MTQPITLTLTPSEASELKDLLHWTNDPQFRGLITQIEVASTKDLTRPGADLTPTTQPES